MKKVKVCVIHVQRDTVIMDGSMNLHTFMKIMHLMFPEDLSMEVMVDNTMVAPLSGSQKFEITLKNGRLLEPYPTFRNLPNIPWFINDMRNRWDLLGWNVELTVYNLI